MDMYSGCYTQNMDIYSGCYIQNVDIYLKASPLPPAPQLTGDWQGAGKGLVTGMGWYHLGTRSPGVCLRWAWGMILRVFLFWAGPPVPTRQAACLVLSGPLQGKYSFVAPFLVDW